MTDTSGRPLSNDDFRKLLMTPRAASGQPPVPGGSGSGGDGFKAPSFTPRRVEGAAKGGDAAAKAKKKSYYKPKKEEEAEDHSKYRDRAAERRQGLNIDYKDTEQLMDAYQNVASVSLDAQGMDRREKEILESKYLGGDMEHTHLVKGLDFALLEKVRSELEKGSAGPEATAKEQQASAKPAAAAQEAKAEELTFRTTLGRAIHRVAVEYRPPERNELFAPGRMAFVFELENGDGTSDIPTTIVRSKADLPQQQQGDKAVTTNEIVMNKLTQILSLMRQGARQPKAKKRKERPDDASARLGAAKPEPPKPLPKLPPNVSASLYDDDLGDYTPATKKRAEEPQRPSAAPVVSGGYFAGIQQQEEPTVVGEFAPAGVTAPQLLAMAGVGAAGAPSAASVPTPTAAAGVGAAPAPPPQQLEAMRKAEKEREQKMKERDVNYVPDTYMECYPGAFGGADVAADSDEDADYSKMETTGAEVRKVHKSRFDFETEEEYNDYMLHREALPRAAFQFGVKTNDGRKTKRAKGELSEKQKIDRDLQRINALIAKRKAGGGDEPAEKAPKRRKYDGNDD